MRLFLILLCISLVKASSSGEDSAEFFRRTYVLTFNFHDATAARQYLSFSTAASSCNVTISVDSPPTFQDVITIDSTTSTFYNITSPGPNKGIMVQGECDFVLYGFNQRTSMSADSFLALPVERTGSEYLVLGVEPWLQLTYPAQLSVVAVNNDTTCTYTFPDGTQTVSDLDALEVDAKTSYVDFSGTRISCTDKVSVFTGQICHDVPRNTCHGCDHVVEQIPPVDNFGRSFALVPPNVPCVEPPICCSDPAFCSYCVEVFRVIASKNNTYVQWTGSSTASTGSVTLNAGEYSYILIPKGDVASVSSTKSVLVAHTFTGSGYNQNNLGDPSYTVVPQIQKYKRRYRGATCFQGFSDHYATLVIKQGTSSQVKLNGATFLNPTNAIAIPGTNLEAFKYQFDCTNATSGPLPFVINHDGNEKFGLSLYGLGNKISYAHPAGSV